jgi:hypothetical protein
MQESAQLFSFCPGVDGLRPELRDVLDSIVRAAHAKSAVMRRHIIERRLKDIASGSTMEYIYRYILPFVGRIDCIAVSENYIALWFRRIQGTDIIGIDSDTGGLFINHVFMRNICNYEDAYENSDVKRCGKLRVVVVSDDDFRAAFGYTDELVNNMVSRAGVYRVQGEVVLFADYVRRLNENRVLIEEAESYLEYVTLDRIAALLLDYGFVPEVIQFRGTRYVRVLGIEREYDVHKVFALMKKYFVIHECDNYDASNLVSCDAEHDTVYGKVKVVLNARVMKPWGLRFYGTYLNVNVLASSPAVDAIINEIIESLKKAERVSVSTRIGRHVIELRRTVPLTFSYMPHEMLYALDPVAISVSLPRHYVVFPETEVFIRHPEHGEKIVRFDSTYLLRIGTTEVTDLYISRLNRIAVRRLQ